MAGSVNKVILIGNLGRDPEIRTFPQGGRVASLRVATAETWRDKTTGERREKTEWHSISIFSENLVALAEKYLKKGSKIYLEGALETRKWQDQTGADRYTTEVVLRPFRGELNLLDARPMGDGAETETSQAPAQVETGRSKSKAKAEKRTIDDEIPF